MLRKLFNKAKYKKNTSFKLEPTPYGINDTERCIEIPWSMSCYNGETKVLDIGYANAEERYINALLNLNIPELHGFDMVEKHIDGIRSHQGDIKETEFPDEFFDFIFCISTIEHIGKDNSIYFKKDETNNNEGDFAAIQEISRILKKKGNLILTAPYGKEYDYGWFVHYDQYRWEKLIKCSGLKLINEDYFLYEKGWKNVNKNKLHKVLYKDNEAQAAAGLVCAMLVK